MSFHDELNAATRGEQEALFAIPFVEAAMAGAIDRATYLAFLEQAYHHVRHTVPLLMACGSRLPADREWLRDAMAHYVQEELGHQEWILSDIAAAGGDAERVRRGRPGTACELMVAYAYDTVMRGNPVGFLGMVFVLEGTSARGATKAAEAIGRNLALPPSALAYLTTHGDLDQDHVGFFGGLVDRLEDPADREAVLHAARVFFRLYGDVFRSLLPPRAPSPAAPPPRPVPASAPAGAGGAR
jgi:pyrroloquinoline quinone (PQQ) biosynthesis protein C